MKVPARVRENPNAATAGISGAGLGTLVVWLLRHLGISFTPEVGAAIAGLVATVALWIGREGLRGIGRRLWRGSGA